MPPKAQAKPIEDVNPPVLGEDDKPDPTPDEPAEEVGEKLLDTSFGLMTEADYFECVKAEVEAEAKAKAEAAKLEEDAKPAPICETCFPQGWDSKNAVGQDAVGCEHGQYARKQPTAISFPADWKSGEPTLVKG